MHEASKKEAENKHAGQFFFVLQLKTLYNPVFVFFFFFKAMMHYVSCIVIGIYIYRFYCIDPRNTKILVLSEAYHRGGKIVIFFLIALFV